MIYGRVGAPGADRGRKGGGGEAPGAGEWRAARPHLVLPSAGHAPGRRPE